MADNTQYYKVVVSSPKKAEKQISVDITQYIDDNLTIEDEDGLIKQCSFTMTQAFLMLDVLAIGMGVHVTAGSLYNHMEYFKGAIKEFTPDFKNSGDLEMKVICYSEEGGLLGNGIRDLIYPSKNHPKNWATEEIMYSDIIVNLAKDRGIKVEADNIKVQRDIKAGFAKGTIRQNGTSDWAFMQELAKKIHCTLWTKEQNGSCTLHLVDDSLVVNALSAYTFFFLSKKSTTEFIDYTYTSDKQLQLISAKVNLNTKSGKGKITQVTDPNTGKTKIVSEQEVNGVVEKWVLDEAKLRALSSEQRNNIMELFMSGKVTWEGDEGGISAKEYFKKEVTNGSSREGEANNTAIEVLDGKLKDDGLSSTQKTTENTGNKSYKTVIDEDKLRTLGSEQRSAIMGRIARGETTEEDRSYYKVVDTTPKAGAEDSKTNPVSGTSTSSTKKEKRDAGFNITGTIYGNTEIAPRVSHVIEGLGKYSGNYYLYRVISKFGKGTFMMELIFTK